jgi:hypothetical protein
VAQYIQRDGRFDTTRVWAMGQRRMVTLMGCVQSREQADALANGAGQRTLWAKSRPGAQFLERLG